MQCAHHCEFTVAKPPCSNWDRQIGEMLGPAGYGLMLALNFGQLVNGIAEYMAWQRLNHKSEPSTDDMPITSRGTERCGVLCKSAASFPGHMEMQLVPEFNRCLMLAPCAF